MFLVLRLRSGPLARDPWTGTHLVTDLIEPWTIRLDARNP